MRIHRLKIDPAPLAALISRRKTAEVRKADRDFAIGDELFVYEFLRSEGTGFTGSYAQLKVTDIVLPGEYGLPPRLLVGGSPICVMSVTLIGYGRLPALTAEQIYTAGQPIDP